MTDPRIADLVVDGQAESARPQLAPEATAGTVPLLIGLDQLARVLGVSTDTVSRLEQTGRLGPRRIQLGRAVRFVRLEVERWVLAGCPVRDQWTWRP